MLTGLALMVVLDAIIISPGPNLARAILALVVTVVVGGFVLATWLSNSRMEREAAQKGGNGEGKSSSSDASGK
jgi:uncharacterized membrane protein